MEETKIIPTVGRVVYFKSPDVQAGEQSPVDRAAIITQVNDPAGNVGLAILNPTFITFNTSVEQGNEAGQWQWMPYQLKSASNSQSAEPRPEVEAAPVEAVAETQAEPVD